MEPDQEVQRLVDEAAIRRIMVQYARGVDRKDIDLVGACFAEDAVAQYPDGPPEGFHGRAAIKDFLQIIHTFEVTMHFMGNQTVELDGDKAWAETYAVAYHRRKGGESDWTLGVRYHDRFERREGRWTIVWQQSFRDWIREDAVVLAPPE